MEKDSPAGCCPTRPGCGRVAGVDLEQARQVVQLMVLAAWADGHVEGSEALTIHKLVVAHPELREVGPTGDLSRTARERLLKLGMREAVRESAAALHDRKYQELAFQCCAKVSGADGEFVPAEAELLAWLQELFGFSAAEVNRLLVLATR